MYPDRHSLISLSPRPCINRACARSSCIMQCRVPDKISIRLSGFPINRRSPCPVSPIIRAPRIEPAHPSAAPARLEPSIARTRMFTRDRRGWNNSNAPARDSPPRKRLTPALSLTFSVYPRSRSFSWPLSSDDNGNSIISFEVSLRGSPTVSRLSAALSRDYARSRIQRFVPTLGMCANIPGSNSLGIFAAWIYLSGGRVRATNERMNDVNIYNCTFNIHRCSWRDDKVEQSWPAPLCFATQQ